MTRRGGARLLIIAAAAAVAVEAVGAAGWWRWKLVAAALEEDPDAGARRLVEEPGIALPSAVRRARRLSARNLGLAPRAAVIAALDRLGTLQVRWFPTDATGFLNLARREILEDHLDLAAALLAKALERDPTSPYLHRLMGLIYLHRGDRGAGMDHLAEAEGLSPGFASPQIELTPEDTHWVRLEGLQRRRALYPRDRVPTAIALSRELRRTINDAAANSVLQEHRGHPEVEIELAAWSIEDGHYREALEILRPIVERATFPRAIRARAWSLTATANDLDGRHEEALQAANEAMRLEPASPSPYIALAELARRRGDPDAELALLRRAWGMEPTDIALLVKIAEAAEAADKPADALLALRRAVEIDTDSPDLVVRLVELQLRQGRYAEAAIELSRATDRFPTDPRMLALAERLRRRLKTR